ncbi:WapI family immunity protein [Cloacibacterium caeni]|uniref:WapI family immunity protein n=1 Tax=Cloacibacterium caeni TaxID=2004710 RepID=UPI001BCCF513|nr:hypothetical protein [Cloacibacterium caeni]
MMEKLSIKGESGNFIEIIYLEVYGFPDNTSHFGGYDVLAKINLKSEDFTINSDFYTSTGEIYNFFENLEKCNKNLSGSVKFISCEDNLEFFVSYNNLGHVNINGSFHNHSILNNKLTFELISDQSYISETLKNFQPIIDKYGNNSGIKNDFIF